MKPIRFEQDNVPHCPYCESILDAHASTSGKSLPMTGDVSICFSCINVLVYEISGADIDLRKPSPDELEEFDKDKDLQKILRVVRKAKDEIDSRKK